MSTTRIFGNNPFEVYLKPTNKIEVKVGSTTGMKQGSVVAYKGGEIVLADARDREASSVLGVVIDLSNGIATIVTQGVIPVAPQGYQSGQNGKVYYLSQSIPGQVSTSPPTALGTTRIPVVQQISETSFLVLGMPGIVNGISYRGYVNIAAIQPVGTVAPYVGNIDSLPKNWLLCDGSYVGIDAYPELYRLVGSIYGEVLDGRFKLPDFRGRSIFGAGGASGLTTRFIGEFGGEEQHSLSIAELPAHYHTPAVGANTGVDHWWGSDDRVGTPNFDYDGSDATKPSDGFIAPSTRTNTVGGNSPHNNMPPYGIANWIIRAKAESEFALLDVNVESLTNVDKQDTPSAGDVIRYDGATWRFVDNRLSNTTDLTVPTTVGVGDTIVVSTVSNGVPSFTVSAPTGTNIKIYTTKRTHKNGSPRPSAVSTVLGTATEAPAGRNGIIHFNGTLEIEPTPGTVDGTVNVNLIGYGGAGGLTVIDTLTIPHYNNGSSKKLKIPFHATVAAQIYSTAQGGAFRFSYYLSTDTGSQFKANVLTIDNVKFVY
jgi:microcystin-dependent protein